LAAPCSPHDMPPAIARPRGNPRVGDLGRQNGADFGWRFVANGHPDDMVRGRDVDEQVLLAGRRCTQLPPVVRLRSLRLDSRVDKVGGDEAPNQKPAPDLLLLALERLRARPEQAVYVGDSPFDMAAAKSGGLTAIGVTWGGVHDRSLLAQADLVVDSPEELLAAL